jgi:ATP-binding cassette, subfamily B, bacterial
MAWRADRGVLAGLVLFTVAGGLAPAAIPALTSRTLDALARPEQHQGLWLLAGGLAAAGALVRVSITIGGFLSRELERKVGLLADSTLFAKVNSLPGLRVFEDPSFQDRLRTAQQEGGAAPSQLVTATFQIAQEALTLAGVTGVLVAYSPPMAALVLLTVLPGLYGELKLSGRRVAMVAALSSVMRRRMLYADLQADPRAAKELRLFGLGGFFRQRMLDELRTANAADRRLDLAAARLQLGLALLGGAATCVALSYGVAQVLAAQLTIGQLAAAITSMVAVLAASSAAVASLATLNQALLLFAYFQDVLAWTPDLPPAPAWPAPARPMRRGIELRDVWFRYSPQHPWVLTGVSLTIPAGAIVALVGPNGAGKSTLVKLLCRLYDPEQGQLLWDGVDLRRMPVQLLRRRVGAVFQDYMQYDLTAAENIGVGDVARIAERDHIAQAARLAGVHEELCRLPDGYDTLLSRVFSLPDAGHPGVELSGGQWQRIALARAFLRNQDLIILDEPSANLDAQAEQELYARFQALMHGRTGVLVSHRFSTVRMADHIAVLEDGRITERGSHPELLALGGTYSRLFRLQAQGYLSDGHTRVGSTAPGPSTDSQRTAR